ncbi:hypothetical protein HH214_14585 [Mucilaginibacter robiniae]|uniref:Uncharacterized protein n=1 Tax=Mucilaginibacter robiniae TaxID=2728022 RepID=A0A7L5E3L8_9SPHI|nr:hypothetical protein [Mucilaginibacter robiniae]QJD97007.1 hypothetical protein HH214_14585 [Mucilaginibacter robiniae]
MDNLDDLKAIWHTAKTDNLPSSKEMVQLIRKFRNEKLRNKWLMILLTTLIALLIGGVLCISHFKLFTTYLGGAMIMAGCGMLAVDNVKSLKRFYQLDDYSNVDFLAFIEQTRLNQIRYYKKTMAIFASLCTVGWALYMYEPIYKLPVWFYSIYSIILTYLAIMWFVVSPRTFKKDQEKLEATRQRIEKLLNQLK